MIDTYCNFATQGNQIKSINSRNWKYCNLLLVTAFSLFRFLHLFITCIYTLIFKKSLNAKLTTSLFFMIQAFLLSKIYIIHGIFSLIFFIFTLPFLKNLWKCYIIFVQIQKHISYMFSIKILLYWSLNLESWIFIFNSKYN